jgi:hypothetical protein
MAVGDSDSEKKWFKDKEKLVPGLIGAAVCSPPMSALPTL